MLNNYFITVIVALKYPEVMRKVFKMLMPIYCAVFLSACSSNYLMTFNGENVKKDEDREHFLLIMIRYKSIIPLPAATVEFTFG